MAHIIEKRTYWRLLEAEAKIAMSGIQSGLAKRQAIFVPVVVASNERLSSTHAWIRLKLLKPLPSHPEPGQFVMIWVPGVKEIPMSVADFNGRELYILLKKVGEATSRLYDATLGEVLGVKGPLGNAIPSGYHNYILIAGGTGIAPIHFFIKQYSKRSEITLIYGAKTARELVLTSLLERHDITMHFSTDDGSLGFKGTAIELFRNLVKSNTLKVGEDTLVVGCGPEPMLKALIEVSRELNLNTLLGLERVMKCGVGVCGSCELGSSGLLVCRDGPWFDYRVVSRYLK